MKISGVIILISIIFSYRFKQSVKISINCSSCLKHCIVNKFYLAFSLNKKFIFLFKQAVNIKFNFTELPFEKLGYKIIFIELSLTFLKRSVNARGKLSYYASL